MKNANIVAHKLRLVLAKVIHLKLLVTKEEISKKNSRKTKSKHNSYKMCRNRRKINLSSKKKEL